VLLKNEDDYATDNKEKKVFRVRYDPTNKVWVAIPLTDNEKHMRELRKKYEQGDTNDKSKAGNNLDL
jgi:hypothetical protein